MLNCAVIGIGSMGKNHARIYSNLSNIKLIAVSDPNKKFLKEISKTYGCKGYCNYKEMIDKEKIDIISIAAPTGLHKDIALYCIDHNINILLEKPIAQNTKEAQEIIEHADHKEVKLMIGHIERFNPAIIELKERIDKGELGKIFKIDVNRVGPFPARIRDVGVVIDLAVHDLDIMRYLTNSECQSLFAYTENKINTSNEDLLSGLLRFKNGTICNLNVNWLTPTKIRKLYITGEKGMFIVNYIRQNLFYYENSKIAENIQYNNIVDGVSEGKMIKYYIHKKEPLLAEIEHFIECVIENKEPLISGEDGLKALKLALLIIESSKEGKPL